MTIGVDPEEWMDRDFGRARRRAFLRRIAALLRNDPSSGHLARFEEARGSLRTFVRIHHGRKEVPVERIVGSVSRPSDFDRGFMPTKASAGERWKRVNRAYHRAKKLPPVSLYEIGGAYFVLDGNHRVSVARYHDVEEIEAEVVEFRLPHPSRDTGKEPESPLPRTP